jgi:hypothetical protein
VTLLIIPHIYIAQEIRQLRLEKFERSPGPETATFYVQFPFDLSQRLQTGGPAVRYIFLCLILKMKAFPLLKFNSKLLNIIKAIYDKPTASIILNRKTETIPFKIRNQTRMPTISTPTQHSTGIPSQSS